MSTHCFRTDTAIPEHVCRLLLCASNTSRIKQARALPKPFVSRTWKGLLTLAGIGGGGAALVGYNVPKQVAPQYLADDNQPTSSNTLNSLIGLGVGAGALTLLLPAYRAARAVQHGYEDYADEGMVNARKAVKAWNTLRQQRTPDYAPVRAVLDESSF